MTRHRRQAQLEKRMESIQNLKSFSADRLSLDELLILRATARNLRSEYDTQVIPVPEWLEDAERRLTRELYLRRQDELEKMLREARQSRAAIATPDEKRGRLDNEISRLEKLLAGEAKPTAPAGV